MFAEGFADLRLRFTVRNWHCYIVLVVGERNVAERLRSELRFDCSGSASRGSSDPGLRLLGLRVHASMGCYLKGPHTQDLFLSGEMGFGVYDVVLTVMNFMLKN